MRCEDCTYYFQPECRRYPPLKGFPCVKDYSWCGEFKSKEVIYAGKEQSSKEIYGFGIAENEKRGENENRYVDETIGGLRIHQGKGTSEKEEKKIKRGWPKGKPRK